MVQATDERLPGWVPADADPTTKAVAALFTIVRLTQALSPSTVDGGVRRLIATLAQTGPARLSGLAGESQLDVSTVSRHVAALEAGGLVRREPDPQDGRACLVALTPEGVETLHSLLDQRVSAVAPVLDRWPSDDRARLFELLHRLACDLHTQLVRTETRP